MIGKIVVVDDGSSDMTAVMAESCGAEVIRMPSNLGKGRAIRKALKEVDQEYVLFLDGDLGEHAIEASKLINAVLEDKADIAVAAFPQPKVKGGLGIAKGFGRWAIKSLTGYNMKEPLSGQRALRREALDKIKIAPGFGVEVAMTIDLIREGYRVLEIPTLMSHRETGRDFAGFWHRGEQFFDILKVYVKRLFVGRKSV